MCELEKIVGGADNGPLGAHFFDAAQQKLAESACLLDLPEHRLGQLFASPIGAGMAASFDLLGIASTRVSVLAGCVEDGAAGASPLAVPATASLARPVAT